MTLGIQDIVEVRAQITPRDAGGREFGRTLLLTTDPTLDAGAGRVGVFASMDEVARTFTPGSGSYQAAQVYFSQVPYPRKLVIGRWINTRESARLTGGSPRALEQITGSPTVVRGSGTVASLDTFHGRATVLTGTGTVSDLVNFHGRATVLTGTGTVADLVNFHGRATVVTGTGTVADLVNFHGRATVVTGTGTVADLVNFHGRATVVTGTGTVASLTTLQGIASGTVTFLGQTVTGLDFSSDTDLDGVASTLQTALRATSATDLDNVEVDYDSAASAFVVTLPLDSSTGVVPTASAAFTGDDADELGLDTATIVNGVDAIVSGTVTFLSQTLTGLDFSAVTDYAGVASVLQTALRATSATSLDEVEVVYDSDASAFVVTIPLDSNGAATSVSAAFTGSESDELGLDTATIVDGVSAIQSGSVTFLSQSLTGLDFSDVTDYDDVASVLQTALRATSSTDLDNAEVTYDSTASAFVVTLPLDSSTGVVPTSSAAFTGTESDELGLDTATIVNGVDAIVSGSVTLLDETFSSLDFSAVTDYDDVASVLQDALRAASVTALASVEVAYQGGVFVVIIPLDSQGAATSVSGAFTGDTADELGLDTATIVDGVDTIKSGTVTFLSQTLTGLDFSAVTDYDDVASVLQTALRGATSTTLDAVEVAYNSDTSAFVVTIPLAADGSATAVTAAFTGATADEVGLDTVTIEGGIDTITAGSVTFHGASLTGLDFSSVTDYDDVAAVVQNALRGSSVATLDAVEVEHDGSQFALTLPLGLDGSATEVSGPFTGEHADELGLGTVEITTGVDGIGAGSLTWQGYTISVDFTGAASYDDVANIVQTALRAVTASGRADLRSASVEYDPADFFRASLGFRTNGDPYPIAGFMADDAQEPASALGLDSTSGGGIDPGHASETIGEAMDVISGLDDGWYFVAVDSGITTRADLLSLSRWVQAKVHMLALDVVDEGVLTPNESTSLAAQLSALEQQRTFLVWSRTRDNKALSLAGRLSSVNFEGQNTLITPKFKSLPRTVSDIVTAAQKKELDRKWVGYYTRFGPDAIFAEGWTQSGDWIDVRYWLDWITKAMQTEVSNLLRQHPTRVPQTAEGLASIEAAIERVCEAGRRNGGIAPGRVSEAVANNIRLAINNPDFDGFLTRGYLVVVGSIADQLEQDRNARKAPPARVWITGSGAMHSATIILTFAG